jgi:hypothetical protein
MRTTVDIPEDILRKAKSQAALKGMSLKDFVSEALRAALYRRSPEFDSKSGDREDREETLHLGNGCVFPLIRGECGPGLKNLTSEKIHEILEEEDVERALYPGGR